NVLPPSRAHLFDEVRFHDWQIPNRRSNQKNLLHPMQCCSNRLRLGVIHDHTFNSGGGFGSFVSRLEGGAYLQPHGQRLLYHFTTDVSTCPSDQNHCSLPLKTTQPYIKFGISFSASENGRYFKPSRLPRHG